MCGALRLLQICVVGLIFHCVNGSFDCPFPAVSSVVYFDMEQIGLMALQEDFVNAVQSPITCAKDNDPACKSQTCCPREIGCCYTDSTKGIRKCGCMEPGDTKCSHPAPLAVIGNSVCEDHSKVRISACLREKRGQPEGYTIMKNSTVQPARETKTNHIQLLAPMANSVEEIFSMLDLSDNGRAVRSFLKQFTIDELIDKLDKTVIDEMMRNLAQRIATGRSYGLPP